MGSTLTPDAIEATAKANGLSVAALCARAGVAHSTFTRWRNGKTNPTLDVYHRLCDAASSCEGAAQTSAKAASSDASA